MVRGSGGERVVRVGGGGVGEEGGPWRERAEGSDGRGGRGKGEGRLGEP